MKKTILLTIICCAELGTKAQTTDAVNSQLLRVSEYKNPAFAYILSIVPGAGQFYNDDIEKGFKFMATTSISATLSYLHYKIYMGDANIDQFGNRYKGFEYYSSIFWGITTLGLYLWQSIDAVTTAHKKNKTNGYVVSLYPSMQNNLCATDNRLGFTPSLGLNLSF